MELPNKANEEYASFTARFIETSRRNSGGFGKLTVLARRRTSPRRGCVQMNEWVLEFPPERMLRWTRAPSRLINPDHRNARSKHHSICKLAIPSAPWASQLQWWGRRSKRTTPTHTQLYIERERTYELVGGWPRFLRWIGSLDTVNPTLAEIGVLLK